MLHFIQIIQNAQSRQTGQTVQSIQKDGTLHLRGALEALTKPRIWRNPRSTSGVPGVLGVMVNGGCTASRCFVGTYRTSAPTGTIQAKGWKAPPAEESCMYDRGPVCTPQWYSLGNASEGVGLRLRSDLLEASARLARSRRLGADSLYASGLAGPQRPDRLVPSGPGRQFSKSRFGGPRPVPISPTEPSSAVNAI